MRVINPAGVKFIPSRNMSLSNWLGKRKKSYPAPPKSLSLNKKPIPSTTLPPRKALQPLKAPPILTDRNGIGCLPTTLRLGSTALTNQRSVLSSFCYTVSHSENLKKTLRYQLHSVTQCSTQCRTVKI